MYLLVTGASGFVGQIFCKKLAENGLQVRGVARSLYNLDVDSCSVIIRDIGITTDWSVLLADVDIVFHLAARVHVMHDRMLNSQLAYDEVNYLATINMAKQAVAAGVKRFVYVSSIKVNGEHTEHIPFNEHVLSNPIGPYALSKWKAEQALLELSKKTDMEVVIVRPPLVYGAGVKANFLSLLDSVYKSLPLPIGSIQNKRSMIYVENLVNALMLCATHPKAAGQTYLVCDDESVSTPDLIRKLALAMHKPNRLFSFPLGLLNFAAKCIGKKAMMERLSQSLEIDCSKIKNDLGWQPPFTLQQGLQKTADWYLQTKQADKP